MSASIPTTLSSGQRKKIRRIHDIFQLTNNFSFTLVNGSVVTLYAMKAQASVSYLGLIASLNFLSFLCVPLGNYLGRFISIVRVYAWGWMLRYIAMIPVLAVPFLLMADKIDTALSSIFIASVLFNIFRGMGIVGNNPVIASLTTEKERSRYIALIFIMIYLADTLAALMLFLVLKISHDNIWAYAFLFTLGITMGVWASFSVFRFPQIPPSHAKQNLFQTVHKAMRRSSFRTFFLLFFFLIFVVAMVRSFSVVYTKEVYHQSDSISLLYTTIGFLGALLMGTFSRLTINVVGAKALYIFYAIVSMVSLLPAILSPQLSGITLIAFLCFFHFVSNFGMYGVETNGQPYLFKVISPEEVSDLFTFYYIIYGMAGGLGSLFGGELLHLAAHIGLNTVDSYRLFFLASLCVLLVLCCLLMRLQNTARRSVSEGLRYMIHMRDIKALSLANKLDDAVSPSTQLRILAEMQHSASDVSEDFLLETLSSPREEIRYQSLYVIESMPALTNTELIDALIQNLHDSPYTTAYLAARVLGKKHITYSIPALRPCVHSKDYRLQGEAIYALALMHDTKSLPNLESLLVPSTNPYVLTRLLAALEKLLPLAKVGLLFRPLQWAHTIPELRHEVLLSGATVLGIFDLFYPIYKVYLKDKTEGYHTLLEYYQSIQSPEHTLSTQLFESAQLSLKEFMALCQTLWPVIFPKTNQASTAMAQTLINPLLLRHYSFRFFIVSYLVFQMNSL